MGRDYALLLSFVSNIFIPSTNALRSKQTRLVLQFTKTRDSTHDESGVVRILGRVTVHPE